MQTSTYVVTAVLVATLIVSVSLTRPPRQGARSTPTPPVTQGLLQTSTPTPTLTPTPTPTPFFPPSFSAQVIPSTTSLGIGDSLNAYAEVYNNSEIACLGMPRFRLRIDITPGVEQDPDAPILEPARPTPIVYYLMLEPGGSVSATFTLRAARPGVVTLDLSVDGEVALGENCGGPYTWGGAGARSVPITVGYKLYLPLLRKETASLTTTARP